MKCVYSIDVLGLDLDFKYVHKFKHTSKYTDKYLNSLKQIFNIDIIENRIILMCDHKNIDEYNEEFWFDSVKYYIKFPDKIWKGKNYVGNLIYEEDYEIDWVDDKWKRKHEEYLTHYKKEGKKYKGLFITKGKGNGSSIAKSGFNEEELCVNYLNSNKDNLRIIIEEVIKYNIGGSKFYKKKGNSKTDILNDILNIQVKKKSSGMPGQVDRRYIDKLIIEIPELNSITDILKGLCELPLIPGTNNCDKSKHVKKLNTNNYTQLELNNFLKILNDNKEKILKFIFEGQVENCKPTILLGVKYNGTNKEIQIYEIVNIINHLKEYDFNIRPSGTVVGLKKALLFKRKSGDNGNKSSNNIQFQIDLDELKKIINPKTIIIKS